VLLALAYAVDPDEIDEMADTYEANGYPQAANALRNRANMLRSAEVLKQDPSTQPGPYYEPQPSRGGSASSGSSNHSILPVLALVGAGIVLS